MKTAYSIFKNPDEAAKDILNQFKECSPRLILFFASSAYDPNELIKHIHSAFRDIPVFGCTTAGEIISGKMLKESIVAMAFEEDIIEDAKIELISDVHDQQSVQKVFKSFETYYQQPALEMNPEHYVGIILIDGLSVAEERVMEWIGDITNVNFVGGAAGDDLKFKSTYVFAGGKAITKAAVIALIKPRVGFEIIKTQSFKLTGKYLTPTKVNEATREVLEFDNRPASEAYSDAVGVSVEEAPNFFMHNPVGLIAGGDPYVRSPQQIKGSSMIFYCHVKQGMKLALLESTDIVEDTRKAIADTQQKLKNIAGLINFHCILRTLELEDKHQTEAYGQLFKDIPTIGFSTYGEEYIGHINQTSTMLVFKKPIG